MRVGLLAGCILLCSVSQVSAFIESEKADFKQLFYKHRLSSKTPYRFVSNLVDGEIKFDGCSANRIWAVYRHGTRTPGLRTMEATKGRLIEIRDTIIANNNKTDKIAKWIPHHELDDKKRLTSMGAEEMRHLGQRLKNRSKSFLPDYWDNGTFVVRVTDTIRTQESAKHFLNGLFGAEEARRVWIPTPLKRDPVLRFYKTCQRWREEVKKNPETKKQLRKFLEGELVSSIIDNVTGRYNLPRNFLKIDDLQLMYTMCCFETSWDRDTESAWCDVFEENEFKVLEYAEDMEYFWIDGFGNELTTQIACPLFQNAFAHLNDEDKEPFVFYFTHSGTILKFLTHLGLYRDNLELMSDNFDEHEERMWRTSKIDAFGSNIVFMRYDCNDGKKYILTLHQEMPVRLPGCPLDTELCSLDTIKHLYRNSLENCDYDALCSVKNNANWTYWSVLVDYVWNSYNSLRAIYF